MRFYDFVCLTITNKAEHLCWICNDQGISIGAGVLKFLGY